MYEASNKKSFIKQTPPKVRILIKYNIQNFKTKNRNKKIPKNLKLFKEVSNPKRFIKQTPPKVGILV